MITLAALPDAVLTAMRAHAAAGFPREVCGVVFERAGQYDAFACRNTHPKAEHRFVVSPADLFSIGQRLHHGEHLAVIYHSHVNTPATFSEMDKQYAAPYQDALHVVFAVTKKGVINQHAYQADGTCVDESVMERA